MVRILALWNLKLWFIVYNEHFVLVEIEIWSTLDDDKVFIKKNQTQQKSVFTFQIMNKRDNLISKTGYRKR